MEGVIVTPLHAHYRPAHLAHVVAQMRVRGAPRIRAHHDAVSGAWFCFEGTHRLRAALQLGLRPVLVRVPWPRSTMALERARHALGRAHRFPAVTIEGAP